MGYLQEGSHSILSEAATSIFASYTRQRETETERERERERESKALGLTVAHEVPVPYNIKVLEIARGSRQEELYGVGTLQNCCSKPI
eukprot:COSAG02_NODE_5581_length_4215_cov_1.971817_2_plen_87_part_00